MESVRVYVYIYIYILEHICDIYDNTVIVKPVSVRSLSIRVHQVFLEVYCFHI